MFFWICNTFINTKGFCGSPFYYYYSRCFVKRPRSCYPRRRSPNMPKLHRRRRRLRATRRWKKHQRRLEATQKFLGSIGEILGFLGSEILVRGGILAFLGYSVGHGPSTWFAAEPGPAAGYPSRELPARLDKNLRRSFGAPFFIDVKSVKS